MKKNEQERTKERTNTEEEKKETMKEIKNINERKKGKKIKELRKR